MHISERGIEIPERILKRTRAPKDLRERYDAENIHFGFGPYPDFGLMEEPCKEHGIMKWTQIGDSTVKLFRMRELIDLYAEYLRKDPDRFYKGKK
jgi:aminoglycoside N3'-acetyltransferase